MSGVHIELDDDDTYTMTFYRIRNLRVEEIAKVSNVYAENLCGNFIRFTGMEINL